MCVDAPENSAIAMQRSVAAQKMELEPSRSTGSESMDHEDPPFISEGALNVKAPARRVGTTIGLP